MGGFNEYGRHAQRRWAMVWVRLHARSSGGSPELASDAGVFAQRPSVRAVRRLVENCTDPLTLALLRAGAHDRPAPGSRERLLRAIGVEVPVLGGALVVPS